MLRRFSLVCAVAAFMSFILAASGADDFRSANGRYSVEFSRNPEGRVLVAVFQHTNDLKGLSWSKSIDWQEPHPGWNSPVVSEVKAHVTGDGKTVILRDRATPQEKNGLRIVRADEKEEWRLRTFENTQLTGARTRSSSDDNGYPPLRSGVSYYHAAALLDFLIDEEDLYAAWFGQTDQWLLVSLKTLQETVVTDQKEIDRLNQLAREKAEKIVMDHQPPALRRAVGALRDRVGRIFPSVAKPQQRSWMSAETTASYLFLGTRRSASDKSLIENLVTWSSPGIRHGHMMGGANAAVAFQDEGVERVLGDFLLARWKGHTNREFISMQNYIMLPDEPAQYLGTVHGSLELPMKIPDNAGKLWAYLIPAPVPVANWAQSSETIRYFLSLTDAASHPAHRENASKNLPFVFKTVLPGEYRLKFVWERHPPAGIWRTNAYTALPGDYESPVSELFQVKAGETLRGISITCTNRIGDAKAYAADDGSIGK